MILASSTAGFDRELADLEANSVAANGFADFCSLVRESLGHCTAAGYDLAEDK
jgi:hypothetical protein